MIWYEPEHNKESRQQGWLLPTFSKTVEC